MFELTLRRLFALPAASSSAATPRAADARIESIHFEDLTTRTVVLAARTFNRLPSGSHVWVEVDGRARRMPVAKRDERGRVHLNVTVTRDDEFAEALAFRTRKGDRVRLSTFAPETVRHA